MIRVRHEGGFVPPDRLVGRIPQVSVYADGRVITEGPQIAIYPGPALPNLQVQQIDPAKVDQLVEQALAAGVGSGADLGQPGVADAPTTVIEVRTAKGVKTVSAEALSEAMPDDPQLTAPQQQAPGQAGRVRQAAHRPAGHAGGVAAVPGGGPGGAGPAVRRARRRPARAAGRDRLARPGTARRVPDLRRLKIGCVTVTGAELRQGARRRRRRPTRTPRGPPAASSTA